MIHTLDLLFLCLRTYPFFFQFLFFLLCKLGKFYFLFSGSLILSSVVLLRKVFKKLWLPVDLDPVSWTQVTGGSSPLPLSLKCGFYLPFLLPEAAVRIHVEIVIWRGEYLYINFKIWCVGAGIHSSSGHPSKFSLLIKPATHQTGVICPLPPVSPHSQCTGGRFRLHMGSSWKGYTATHLHSTTEPIQWDFCFSYIFHFCNLCLVLFKK